MKFSLFTEIQCPDSVSPVDRLREFLDQAELADRLNYDAYWIAEIHCQPRFSLLSAPYVVLGAAAQRTQRLRLGVAVNTLPVHHPVQLAEQAAMLDVVSNGRMEFAAGGGHPHSRAYECFGIDHKSTHDIMAEGLQIIAKAWCDDILSFDGKFFQIPEVRVNPKPLQQPPPPFYMATSSLDGVEVAARLGVNLFLPIHTRTPEQVEEYAGAYWTGLSDHGHDYARRTLGLLVPIHLANTAAAAKARAEALVYDWGAPRDVRIAASLVAGDAAHALGAYKDAMARYGEFLSAQPTGPDAAHAMMQMGWVQLRDGQRDAARGLWVAMADRFPSDARVPVVLNLAAEVAIQAGDTATAQRLLDRVIAQYPSSAHAGAAQLSRSIVALREQREAAAVRDLDEVVRSHGPSAVVARRGTVLAVAQPHASAAGTGPRALRAFAPTGPSVQGVGPSDDPLAQFAAAFLLAGEPQSAPYVLHGLSAVGAVDRGWADHTVATLVERLVDGWPSYPAAPELLGRVVASAAARGQWPIARRAYDTLAAHYRGSPVAATAGVDLAEALLRAGARPEARAYLNDVIAAGGPTQARALMLLAQVEEGLGNRTAALAAYDRVLREHPRAEWSVAGRLSHARMLESSGQPDRARSVLQRVVDASEGEVAGEASYRIGRLLTVQGQEAAAAEWYMTAAYVAEGTRWERPSLLGAVHSFTALDQTDAALIAYRKVLATPATTAPRESLPAASASALPRQRPAGDGFGEVSLRLGETLRRAGDHEGAVEVYLTTARLTTGSPAAPRALLGAIRSLVAVGNRAYAEAIFQRLLESGTNDAVLLAEARKTLLAP